MGIFDKEGRDIQMKYIWIVMLAVFYLVWTAFSIEDIIISWRSDKRIDDSTEGWIAFNTLGIFTISFIMWLIR